MWPKYSKSTKSSTKKLFRNHYPLSDSSCSGSNWFIPIVAPLPSIRASCKTWSRITCMSRIANWASKTILAVRAAWKPLSHHQRRTCTSTRMKRFAVAMAGRGNNTSQMGLVALCPRKFSCPNTLRLWAEQRPMPARHWIETRISILKIMPHKKRNRVGSIRKTTTSIWLW